MAVELDDCACGHVADEHEWNRGPGACAVEGCPCVTFEAAEPAEKDA